MRDKIAKNGQNGPKIFRVFNAKRGTGLKKYTNAGRDQYERGAKKNTNIITKARLTEQKIQNQEKKTSTNKIINNK